MNFELLYDKEKFTVTVPDDAVIIQTSYPTPVDSSQEIVHNAISSPIQSDTLTRLIQNRKPGDVVIVVSDITRPIPYADFLDELLDVLLNNGIKPHEIVILISTGMHRPSTVTERIEILGKKIAENFRVIDHKPEADDLVQLEQHSWAGNHVYLNKHFLEAGFKITTGLVEPHFMAGFSGGRKAVCPGLVSLQTVQDFHGFEFLNNPKATIASLADNPCHQEALSIAKLAQVDFSLNVVINHSRKVIAAFAGDLEQAHLEACKFVKSCATPVVEQEFDVILTCSAGYPLDATFYQCVKGIVACLPAIKAGGTIITTGGCSEGIGSNEYTELLLTYADDHKGFLRDISQSDIVIKDQWQHQMHCRALDKVGKENIHFVTDNLSQETLSKLSVKAHAVENVQERIQQLVDEYVTQGKRLAVIPEGPYCSPISKE